MTTPETNGEDFQPREFTTVVGEYTVVLKCDYRLEQQAEWLLKTIGEIHKTDPIQDGSTIEVGWSILVLVASDTGKLIVCEPDFDEDPLEKVVDDITRTLYVLAEQNYIITETHTAETAQIPRFDQTVILKKGVLDEENIYLERSEQDDENEDDSGWFIGNSDDDDIDEDEELSDEEIDEEYEACYVYELLAKRPALLSVLGLPTGYIVVFVGDEIDAIVDENDEDIWNIEHTNGVA
jgi:hypothetical protein